jgi:hypothetical protein
MSSVSNKIHMDRRSFLTHASVAGAGIVGAALLAGCGGSNNNSSSNSGDGSILSVAITAEALAVTTYTNLIASNLYKVYLAAYPDDQAYLVAAQAEEQIHLNELVSAFGASPSSLSFYYPVGMFTSAQVTMNTLVALEEAFIAAYLVGVGQFSTSALRVLAARILGVESDHRSLARVIAADLGLSQVAGLSNELMSVKPANNLGYEQTFELQSISDAQTDLLPYTNATSAATAGFSSTAYPYVAVNVSGSPYNNIGS